VFRRLFGDGSHLGVAFAYAEQPRPEGLAQAFLIGQDFIGQDTVCLILGDNIFYGPGLSRILARAVQLRKGGLIFGYPVRDPERYGVVEFDGDCRSSGSRKSRRHPSQIMRCPGSTFTHDVIRIAAASAFRSRRARRSPM